MNPVYFVVESIAKPWLNLWFKMRVDGHERIGTGARILACNHNSYIDPLLIGYACKKAKRRGRFLAKSELFKVPVLGWALRSMKHISVERKTSDAQRSLDAAEQALRDGEVVLVFAEGTIGPGLPLLTVKSGAARLSAATGVPITPVAMWGGQNFWPKRAPKNFKPGKTINIMIGEDLTPPRGDSREEISSTTAILSDELARLVEKTKALQQ